MPSQYRHSTTGTALTVINNDKCQLCYDRDPQIRSRHHLFLAKEQSLDYVREHLEDSYGHKVSEGGNDGMDTVRSIMAWIVNLMDVYSGMADANTGGPLTWWRAREAMAKQAVVIAEGAYRRAPRAYQEQIIKLQDVSALQHLTVEATKEN